MKTKTNKSKFFLSLGLYLAITALMLAFAQTGFAQGLADTVREVGTPTELPGFETGGHSDAALEQGAAGITSGLLFAIDLFIYLIGSIAVIVIIAAGVRLITATKQIDEVAPAQKENLKYAGIGLIIVILARPLVRQVFYGQRGEVFRSQADAQLAAERGVAQIEGLYNFVQIFAAAIAVFMIITAGVRLLTSGGNEEATGKAKTQITWAVIGLMLLGVSELLVKGIIFPDQGSTLPDVVAARAFIKDITNFVAGFIATVAVGFLMYGGVLYVTAAGNEENTSKAKKIVLGAVIGMLISMGAFALVNTFISFDPELDTPEEIQSQAESTIGGN